MNRPPKDDIPRPSFEYSRDGQRWVPLSSGDLDQLTRYLFSNPFTGRRVLEWYQRVGSGDCVELFPGRDFTVFLRNARQ